MKHLWAVCAAVVWVSVLSPDPALYAADPVQDAEVSFKLFNQHWMENLYSREAKNKAAVVCKQVDDGFVAEYTGYSRAYSARTKKTDCRETPYIGILNYQEQTFVSRARTYEEAINGQFKLY